MRTAKGPTLLGLAVLVFAALAQGAASRPLPQPRSGEPLCRHAAQLPMLPPEGSVAPVPATAKGPRGRVVPERFPSPPPPPPPPPSPPPPPPPPPPPSAPPPPGESAPGEGAEISVTGTRIHSPSLTSSTPVTVVGTSSRAPATEGGIVSRRSGSGPAPQSGQLTAGDHDDLLNPELYARYVANYLKHSARQRSLPQVDTGSVLTVAVQDAAGRPVPFAKVTLTCADGNSLTLATLADGTALFYPQLDRLGARVRLSVAAAGLAPTPARTILIASQAGAQRQGVTLARGAVPIRKFDLLVALDTTGSMGDEIAYLKSELRAILTDLKRRHPDLDLRLSLVAYRDIGDEFVTRTYPFTSDLDRMQANLAAQSADGGGDLPEAMEQALARAVAQEWRPDAVKSMLLVADAPPHDENLAKSWAVTEAARERRIQIVPVAASGIDDTAEYMMRAMAAATQSRYLFLTDDSGIGNPHAVPSVDCFVVTRLDRLVRRVLDSQISGRRLEPEPGEAIRTVGQYDHGKCVLPPDFTKTG